MQPGRDTKTSRLLRAARPRVYKPGQQTEDPAEISCQFLFSDTKGKETFAHIKFRVNYQYLVPGGRVCVKRSRLKRGRISL